MLLIVQDSQVLFCKSAFHPTGPQHVLLPGVISPLGQDLVSPFVECQDTPVSPFFQPITIYLSDFIDLVY